jgi:hypothetical protein
MEIEMENTIQELKQQWDAMISKGYSIPCIETAEGIFYIQLDVAKQCFKVGATCNAGLLVKTRYEIQEDQDNLDYYFQGIAEDLL